MKVDGRCSIVKTQVTEVDRRRIGLHCNFTLIKVTYVGIRWIILTHTEKKNNKKPRFLILAFLKGRNQTSKHEEAPSDRE